MKSGKIPEFPKFALTCSSRHGSPYSFTDLCRLGNSLRVHVTMMSTPEYTSQPSYNAVLLR